MNGIFSNEKELYGKRINGFRYAITENGSAINFRVNGVLYSALKKGSVYVDSYHDYFTPLPLLFDSPKALVIGLGIGTIPAQFSMLYGKGVSVDVVETEEECIRLTKRFLEDIKFNIIHEDGLKTVKDCKGKYDLIIQDAYITDRFPTLHIPYEFMRRQFMQDAFNALKEDGILAINYAPDVVYLPIYIHNLKKHFRHVYRIRHIFLGNYILICSKTRDKDEMIGVLKDRMGGDKGSRELLKAYQSMR